MSKIGNYLQEHLNGELLENIEVRRYYSMDQSPLQIMPSFVAMPADERDIRKINRFSYQMSQRGRYLPITPRGYGSSTNGSSLGQGLIINLTNHLNNIISLDQKSGLVRVEAGINFNELKKMLLINGLHIPFDNKNEKVTLGGIISSNSIDNYSLNKNDLTSHIKSLKIILSNGEILETTELNNKELSKKMGQLNFEGEIYRAIDSLLEENTNSDALKKNILTNSAGYNIQEIKSKHSFNLTPLIIGSEGTLGIITEIVLKTEHLKIEDERYILASFENNQDLENGLNIIRSMSTTPDYLEYFDKSYFDVLDIVNPNYTVNSFTKPYSSGYLIIGFIGQKKHVDKGVIKTLKNLREKSSNLTVIDDLESEISLKHKIDNMNKVLLTHYNNSQRAYTTLSSLAVPREEAVNLLKGINLISKKLNIKIAIHGSIADGNLSIISLCDVNEIGDRQSYFKLINELSDLAISYGGSLVKSGGVGRLLTPYINKEFNSQTMDIFRKIKNIFDPFNILNPYVRFDTKEDDIKKILTNIYIPKNLENI